MHSPMSTLLCLSAVILLFLASAALSADTAPTETQPATPKTLRMYVGTYTGPDSKGIYLYDFDPATGALRPAGLAAESDNPAFLAIAPNGLFLYAANEISKYDNQPSGAVSAFAINPATGRLKLLNQQPSGGVGPCYVSLDALGRNALVANYSSGSVAVLPIQADGRLDRPATIDQHTGQGPNAQRQEGPHAHSIALELSGRFALSADLGTDKLYLYRFDSAKNTLTLSDPSAADLAPGAGPRHFAIPPGGQCVYVINELNSTVTAFAADWTKPAFKAIQSLSTLPTDFKDTNYPADLHVHPSGKFLYGSNRGHDSIVIFRIDPDTGRLSLVGHQSTRGHWPRNFTLDPTGRWLIVANQQSNSLAVFRIDIETGRLTPQGDPVKAPAPACLCFAPGATTTQPATTVGQKDHQWIIDNAHLRVTVDPQPGTLRVLDKASGYEWRQPEKAPPAAGPAFRNVRAEGDGLIFDTDFSVSKGQPHTLTLRLRLPASTHDLVIAADRPDRDAPLDSLYFLPPLLLDTPAGVMAVADYANGHLYPLDLKPFRATWLNGDRLDMPWVGLCDLEKGLGYCLILETSDDAVIETKPYPVNGRELFAPRITWRGSQGKFAYARKVTYRFTSAGGYVALAKAYRAYAQDQGLLVTLAEKQKRKPNLERLYGAVDVWGATDKQDLAAFAREAHAAGVERMILHGKAAREKMQAANDLGYLTSEYDNYTDIQPLEAGHEPDSTHDQLPDHAVLNADGQRMKAWLTYDKKTQFMKRCPSFWVPSAKLVIPKVLEKHPFLGRFIDVTTAEALYECADPQHPLTKAQKRHCGEDLLAYVDSLQLVVGGEHGIWWGVPHLDYIEGMMSSPQFAWPAGHLIRPKSRDEKFAGPYGTDTWDNYAKWSIGHEHRVPLWELVFHDCVVSTWYWGDATDWLMQVDPDNAARKDAFNILYGTIPLLWANPEGSWQKNRDLFLRSCQRTSRLHRAIAGTEMLSHEFVTPDRAVQRTRFSDGTEVIVNFGKTPYACELAGRRYQLPQYGFAVHGPRISQSLSLVNDQPAFARE